MPRVFWWAGVSFRVRKARQRNRFLSEYKPLFPDWLGRGSNQGFDLKDMLSKPDLNCHSEVECWP